jgi:MFS family permease
LLGRVREELGFLRGNLLVLMASYMVFGFTSGLFGPFRSLYIRELGASPFIIGLMSSVGYVILAFIRIPGAYIADRYGRRNVIAVFTFGAALSYAFYVFAWDWRVIMVAVVVSSLSHIYQPALEAIEADSLPPGKRGVGYSLIWIMPGVPAFLGPMVSGYVVERQGLVPGMRLVYVVVFVCTLIVAWIRWRFLKETVGEGGGLGQEELVASFRESFGSIWEAWRGMGREVRYVTLVYLLMSLEFPLYDTFYSLFAYDVVGVTGIEWGLIYTMGSIALILVGYPAGKIVDRIGRRRSMLLAYLLSTPTLLGFMAARGFTQMALVNISFQVSTAFFFPALNALRADIVPRDRRGRIMGLMGTLRSLAMVPAATVFGYLYEVDRAYPYIIGVVIEVVIVAVIYAFVAEPTEAEI